MSLISQAVKILELEDPAIGIRLRVQGLIDEIEIGGQDIIVGVYEPSKNAKTSGGILLPDSVRTEYRWQGCTGLVLKIGPHAYKTEKTEGWFNAPPKVGSWVMFDVKTSDQFLLGTQPCRFVACQYIRGVITRPDLVA